MQDLPEKKLSIIAPCYNEEAVLEEFYTRMTGVLRSEGIDNYEMVMIDDGSRDRTPQILKMLAAQNASVKMVRFSRNFGHQAAVSAGIQHASGDRAVIIDADLQDPPELIPDMLRTAESLGANVVYAVRRERKGEGLFKIFSARFFYRTINSLSDTPLPLDTGDFRLIDKKVITEFKKLRERNKYVRGLISWIGFKQVPILYDRDPRYAGETKYSLSKMMNFAAQGLLYFTKKPLRLATMTGFLSILVGLLLTVYVVVSKYFREIQAAPGWASTLISIIFFGGVQLLTIGVMGEYIGSIFDEVKNRPEYIIDETINL